MDVVTDVTCRPLREDERDWAIEVLTEWWGGTTVAGRGRVWDLYAVPGIVAEAGGERVGLVTYSIEGDHCEIVTMNGFVKGAGGALLRAVADTARAAGCERLQVMTTNDNANAIRFYQRHGMRFAALRIGAVDEARRTLKPQIPEIGNDGIPIRDEIDFAMDLR